MRKSELSWITPSEIMEYLYCPRFIYFMNCLLIPQNEEQRYKVQLGRNIHNMKLKINKNYLRKKIGVKNKITNCYLSNKNLGIRGVVDEILFFEDNTGASLDYKYAKFEGKIYKTYLYQSVLYALLIEHNFNIKVKKCYICYIRSKNHLEKIEITEILKNKVLNIIDEMFKIIELNFFPKATNVKKRCIDCCYKNICIK